MGMEHYDHHLSVWAVAAERWLKQALENVIDGKDAIAAADGALTALRIEAGELPADTGLLDVADILTALNAAGIDTDMVTHPASPADPDSWLWACGEYQISFGPATTETGDPADGWDIHAESDEEPDLYQNWVPDAAACVAAVAELAATYGQSSTEGSG